VNTRARFDVLLFDLGEVLMDFAGFDVMGRFLPGTPARSKVRELWIRSEAVRRFERGRITAARFAESVVSELNIGLSPSDFLRDFVHWARKPSPETISLLGALGDDHRIAALSNANELHTPLHRKRFSSVIETFYFSDEIGLVKPDRAIFEHVIHDLRLSPDRIAYFDDTPVNIEAALRTGLIAHEVDGVDELRIRLTDLGLIEEV
jgi:putative hydrolase of the HAD superfamily